MRNRSQHSARASIGDTRCRRAIPAAVRDLNACFRAGALGYKPAVQPLMSLVARSRLNTRVSFICELFLN
jgi:hypothetical protein